MHVRIATIQKAETCSTQYTNITVYMECSERWHNPLFLVFMKLSIRMMIQHR